MSIRALIDVNSQNQRLVKRAAAVLEDELAHGALSNIRAVGTGDLGRWPDVFQSPARRRSADELERLLEAVLNVVVTAASTAVAYLSRGIVAPGRTVDFVARLANDMPHPVDLTFGVTDFVCGPRMRINADCVQLSPNPVRIPAGGTTDVAIALRIPLTAPVGIYKAVLKSNEFPALQASLTVAVG